MTPYLKLSTLLSVLAMFFGGGCVSWKQTEGPYMGHWRLLDEKQRVLEQKFDRAQLVALAGKPTIDDGEEWVYVSKFEEGDGIPLDMIMAIYSSGPRSVWKTTVVTFDEAGLVSGIRTSTERSEISERLAWWTLMGMNMQKNVRMRKVPATQASTSRPSNIRGSTTIPSAPAAR